MKTYLQKLQKISHRILSEETVGLKRKHKKQKRINESTDIEELLDDEVISKDDFIQACLKFLSTDDLKELMRLNGWDDL